MDAYNTIKLILLILALPAQYYLSQKWSHDVNQQNQAIHSLITSFSNIKNTYLNLEEWKKWYISLIDEKLNLTRDKRDRKNLIKKKKSTPHYDIALEVLNYRKSEDFNGQSSLTRSPRPSKVLYRVGQVVRHKLEGYHGVIIGWDENFKNRNGHEGIGEPHYSILIDKKYQSSKQTKYYVAQESLQLVFDAEVENHLIASYFEEYQNGVYWSGKYLKTVYPDDQ